MDEQVNESILLVTPGANLESPLTPLLFYALHLIYQQIGSIFKMDQNLPTT